MPKLRLNGTAKVRIELSAKNALTISGGYLAGGMHNSAKVIPPLPRSNPSVITWEVPGQSGSSYYFIGEVPAVDGVPASQYQVERVVIQPSGSSTPLQPSSANPKLKRLTSKTASGGYRWGELIDLI